ncbi:metallophosphoesterase [Bacillus alkalicellulosilyticus]|uniref:metallophosphoesterase n=1 Tax=Alkalihalobacterium alkalicellulosilyticum TaxID=1912214 RepID=UPI00099887FF|nr:metallophosphoesterase [Bacillus alkalicellulosilyticus]
MKLGYISDLHIDINRLRGKVDIIESLIDVCTELRLDALCIGGDVTNHYELTLETLYFLEDNLQFPVYFIPGNHDLWNESTPEIDTWQIYQQLQKYRHNLANGPQALTDDWVLIGDVGWYDFSFRSDKYSEEKLREMKFKGRTWRDKELTSWTEDPASIHRYFLEKIERQLIENQSKNIVLCTHVVPNRHFIVPTPHRVWDYYNAFLGSEEYGVLAQKYKVAYMLCGHVHFRKKVIQDGTTFLCSCLGYLNQWREKETKREIRHAITKIIL